MTKNQFQVQYLMMKNNKEMLTSLLMFVAALFVTIIAPSLLLRYVYAGQQLLVEPKLMEYIPLVSAVVACLYFVYAIVGCLIRSRKIKLLMNQVEMMSDLDVTAGLNEDEISELEAIVDEAIAKKKPIRKVARKKTVRKTRK